MVDDFESWICIFELERVEFKTWKGLNRGDRIGMYAVNHYEWIVTQLAAAKAGLILGKDAQKFS